MPWRELGMTWAEVWLTVVTAVGVYAAIIAFSRLWGQRQFATSSTYDLAFIFALGSVVGRVILVRTSLANAVVGLVVMFAMHSVVGWLHHHVEWVHRWIQNSPILVLAHGRILDDHLQQANTSRYEVHEAIRLSGYASTQQVSAVVLERNGEFTVIGRDQEIEPAVFEEVVGAEHLDQR